MARQRDPDAGYCQPAPGRLKVVQGLVNTRDLGDGRDRLASVATLRDWLAAHALLDAGAPLDATDVERVSALREALRSLLLANNGAPLDADAIVTVNRLARRAPLLVQLDAAPKAAIENDAAGPRETAVTRLEPATSDGDGAIAALLAIVDTAMVSGSWSRLKACRDAACHWAFYDTAKNRSATWCRMAVCGNRNKVRAYQRRVRGSG